MVSTTRDASSPRTAAGWYVAAMEELIEVVQTLSHARDLDTVTRIVRSAARRLTGADGATFVLRDGDQCYYADEDAISPLWKGRRFPMDICISGWVMGHAMPAVIEDIYQDARIPVDAYRPTFVKSLAMVPIRKEDPIGAIGNYWASLRQPTDEEVTILQALANVTSVTMANIELYGDLQNKMRALEASNEELGRFAWSAAHDLKSPLRAIDNIAQWLEEDLGEALDDNGRRHMDALHRRARRMSQLLDGLLEYAQLERHLEPEPDDLIDGAMLIDHVLSLVYIPPGFEVRAEGFEAIRLPEMLFQRILCNLLNNTVKHHDRDRGLIEIRAAEHEAHYAFAVGDDGPGIDPAYRTRVFDVHQTLRPKDRTESSGMGLPVVKKILDFYGGEIDIEANTGRGTVVRFTWPKRPAPK